jgi:DNA-binding NtrC family response regulator
VRLTRRHPWPAVIVEHQPPGFDGLCLLEGLRQRNTQTPILLISYQYGLEPYLEAMNLGALDDLNKPTDYIDIQRLVKTSGQPVLDDSHRLCALLFTASTP